MAVRTMAVVLAGVFGIVTATAAGADPIQLVSGSYNNTRSDTSLTAAGSEALLVNLLSPNPSWFGILNPGELISFDFTIINPFPLGTVQVGDLIYPAPTTFEASIRTPEFLLMIGASPPFALEGSLSNGFGRVELRGGGTLSVSDQALAFNFESNPPPVPPPAPEPATWLLLGTGLAIACLGKRRAGLRCDRCD